MVSPLSPHLRIHFFRHFFFSEKNFFSLLNYHSATLTEFIVFYNVSIFQFLPPLFPTLLAKLFPQENVTFLFSRHGYFFPYVLNEAEALTMKVSTLLYHTKS